jgi:hypothetical protein
VLPANARETVEADTPASRAISAIFAGVARRRLFIIVHQG